jgi:dsRNA-specific ribonuclease
MWKQNAKMTPSNSQTTFDALRSNADIYGLSAALDMLTEAVREGYRQQVVRLDRKWEQIEDLVRTEEEFADRCRDFLATLRDFRGVESQANEICCALYHPSFKTDFSSIFRRGKIQGNVRSLPSTTAGKLLIDFVLTNHLIETKWVLGKSVGALSNAARVLGSNALTEKFWLDRVLSLPLVERSFSGEKYHIDGAYKRLAHAIFLYEGYPSARDFIIRSLDPTNFLNRFSEDIEFGDSKTLLQEYFQSMAMAPPKYSHVLEPARPDHDPRFNVKVSLPGIGQLSAIASSKSEAEKQVAELAVIKLRANAASKGKLYELLAAKSRANKARHRLVSISRLPETIEKLSSQIEQDFGLTPVKQGIYQSLLPRKLGLVSTGDYPDSDVSSRAGAIAIDLALISVSPGFRPLGVEAAHPRLCTLMLERFSIIAVSKATFGQMEAVGVPVQRQIAQSIVYSMFPRNVESFFDAFCSWIRKQSSLIAESPTNASKTPSEFAEEFSYATVLQEAVQKVSPVLPSYKFTVSGQANMPEHTAFCTYGGITTRGTSIRRVWAKNRAAYEMLSRMNLLDGQRN